MYKKLTLVSFIFVIFLGIRANGQDSKSIIYVGTYNGRGSLGLYVYSFNQSLVRMTKVQTVSNLKGPNFQAVSPHCDYLYSVSHESFSKKPNKGTIASYKINSRTGQLTLINEQPVGGQGPAHVSIDPKRRFAYVSNYSSGNLSVFAINEDGSLTESVDVIQHEGSSINKGRQSAPHMHSIVPSADGRFIYASDLGIDKIMIYAVNQVTGELNPAKMSYVKMGPGSGPRHFTFHPNNKFAYSLEEISSTITVFSVNQISGGLKRIQRISTLPDKFVEKNQAADIHISPDGRFLYASNRGHNSLAIYKINKSNGVLTWIGSKSAQGEYPRSFIIDKQGKFVLVANKKDDNIVVFRRNITTGKLSYTGTKIYVPLPACLTQVFLN